MRDVRVGLSVANIVLEHLGILCEMVNCACPVLNGLHGGGLCVKNGATRGSKSAVDD